MPGPFLRGILVARGHVDHVDEEVFVVDGLGRGDRRRGFRSGGAGSVAAAHDKHRPQRTGRDGPEPGTATRTEDYEACLVIVGRIYDRLPDWCSLDCAGLCPESCRLGQRGSVRGGLLSSLLYLVGACGVELCLGLWKEPDVECSPDGEDQRVSLGWQLPAGLCYRGFGQVRTVVGEHYGADLVAVPVDRVPTGKAGQ